MITIVVAKFSSRWSVKLLKTFPILTNCDAIEKPILAIITSIKFVLATFLFITVRTGRYVIDLLAIASFAHESFWTSERIKVKNYYNKF